MARQKSKFALLGLLSWKPMSGYDIKKLIDVGLSHFWNEHYGQIYPTLDSLVKEGLATKKEDATHSHRKRFVYTITQKGQQAFREWLSEPTAIPNVRNEFQLKFFLSSQLSAREPVRLIKEYQAQQRVLLEQYRQSAEVLRTAGRDGVFPEELNELLGMTLKNPSRRNRIKQSKMFLLALRHGVRAVGARLAWCTEALESLN